MLRSMIIGLAIAALLLVGGHSFSSGDGVSLTAKRIDWVQVQTDALSRLVSSGYTSLIR
jgi:hypothetical protein